MSVRAEGIEALEWDAFLDRFQWDQGEHVTLIGTTGCGKTTLGLELIEQRDYPLIVATKPSGEDAVLEELARKRDWHVCTELPLPNPAIHRKVIFWPSWRRIQEVPQQREQIRDLLYTVWERGSHCVYLDELRWVSESLKLKPILEVYWQQGRSLGISFVTNTQRPAWVPRVAYSQAEHVFLWRTRDPVDLHSLSGMGQVDPQHLRRGLRTLGRHDFIYANHDEGDLVQSRVRL
jgi:hypothetical protein